MIPSTVRATRGVATAASGALRGLAAALAGFTLTVGLAMVLWALSPSDSAQAGSAARSGAVALAAAHFLPVTLSGAALTLRPLLLTGVIVAVIATAVGRARPVAGRGLEAMHAAVFVAVYAVSIDGLVRLVAPADSATGAVLPPLAIAAVGAVASLAVHDTAWRRWLRDVVPPWARTALRSAFATLTALIATAGLVLAAALAVSFPDALGITDLTVHSLGDAVGVTLVSLAFVPNAVIAAIGYVSGAGFSLGDAAYSPLAVHSADLPAFPLLSAVPSGPAGAGAWATLAAPVAAAIVGALMLRGVGRARVERLVAVGITATAVAGLTMMLVAIGRGGVSGGAWQTMGAAPLLTGALIGGVTLLVTGATVLPVGWRELPWRTRYDVVLDADGDGPAGQLAPDASTDQAAVTVQADAADAVKAHADEAAAAGGWDVAEASTPVEAVPEVETTEAPKHSDTTSTDPSGTAATFTADDDAPTPSDGAPPDPFADAAGGTDITQDAAHPADPDPAIGDSGLQRAG